MLILHKGVWITKIFNSVLLLTAPGVITYEHAYRIYHEHEIIAHLEKRHLLEINMQISSLQQKQCLGKTVKLIF